MSKRRRDERHNVHFSIWNAPLSSGCVLHNILCLLWQWIVYLIWCDWNTQSMRTGSNKAFRLDQLNSMTIAALGRLPLWNAPAHRWCSHCLFTPNPTSIAWKGNYNNKTPLCGHVLCNLQGFHVAVRSLRSVIGSRSEVELVSPV